MNGQTIEVPVNSVLLFMGGSFYNGTLTTGGYVKVFNFGKENAVKDIAFTGDFIDGHTGYEIGKEKTGISTYRPTFNTPANNIGFEYFDETLKKPIWWTGEEWVDANRESV